ncbi:MAG TPA: hypothetical protein VHE30_16265 [Polyangiaceae bacterium]|nr:hypothetical protein [Polyangiaceae bacterium]
MGLPRFAPFLVLALALAPARRANAGPDGGRAKGGAAADSSPPSTEQHAAPPITAEGAFSRATAFYEAGQYGECVSAFHTLFSDPVLAGELPFRSREQAHVYHAACLIAQGKTEEADDQFRAAIRESPQMAVPNAIVFPPPVIERFIIVRSEMLEEIRRSEEERAERQRLAAQRARERAEAERRRIAELERLASEETIVTHNRRWMASVPFGVGQFQNRDYTLGAVFLGSEALLVATALSAVSIELSLHAQAKGGAGLRDQGTEVEQLNQNILTAHRVSLYATGAFILVLAGGILEANLSYVPEFRDGKRQRKVTLPSAGSLTVAPEVTAERGGAELGIVGRF